MKKSKIFGVIIAILAAACIVVGVAAENAKDGDGAFAAELARARELKAAVESNAKAVKNAATLEKKAATAMEKLEAVEGAVAQAAADMDALDAALAAGETGDADVDALRAAQTALGDAEGADALADIADAKVLALYAACVADAYDAVSGAEAAVNAVREGAQKVFTLAGDEARTADEIALTEEYELTDVDSCRAALAAMAERAAEVAAYEDAVNQWTADATECAAEAASVQLDFKANLVMLLADNFIGVMFTAALLIVIALVALFLAEPFARQWAQNPVFSVFIALMAMLVFQTYALGFAQGSVGAWAKFWFDNTFNVLRANTSVGMIALGMTLIIITGGIDLAVGSTLAGVGTVLMAMIDTGDHGFLIRFGITGVPAYIIGIAVALAFGAAIGGVIGLLVTKGRIPPFIVTLGVMNVVRSVCQYFTKSYTPTVPKEFEVIANKMVLGQRPMTIIYWVILAVIFYFIMRNTAFGRHVYAVGSNERTTRLSGINTDRVKLKVYMLSGLVVAIAAVAQLSRLGGMDVASAGSGYELDAIAAVVVGGTSMAGGRGSIVGTVLGVLIIGIMNNLLILLGVDSFLTEAFKGAIVVISVLMQRKEKAA
jgi:ribose transport system permease protein